MRTPRTASAVAFSLLVLLSSAALPANAQAPTGSGPSNVPYLDNQPHTLPANSSQLYRFDYRVNNMTGERPITNIVLVNGNNSGVGFEVWTSTTVGDMVDDKPVGRGTTYAIDCDTGLVSASGPCQSRDLTWSGAFGASGTYYANVVNHNDSPATFLITIQGTGVGLGTPTAPAVAAPAPATSGPTASPSPAPAPTTSSSTGAPLPNVDDPNKAGIIDNQPHTLAAHAATWYRIDYSINHMTGERPELTLTLVNGNNSGVGFQVYAPENINGWWNNRPTGRGTVQMVDCNTGEPSETGQCQSPNLVWQGNFGADGTYYVRAVNGNSSPSTFLLTLSKTD